MGNADFLTFLCDEKKIQFVGETGFDFFGNGPLVSRTPDALRRQTEAFLFQARLATNTDLPLVVHLRKATDVFMAHCRELVRVPSVIFHCWPGRLEEAIMILSKGINAYFSFGTPLLRDSKHAIESLIGLPRSRILSETDAPWQPPHGAPWTKLEHIVDVVDKMATVIEIDPRALVPVLEKNFSDAYLLTR
jgi:TatD DNase family protein